MKNKQIKELRFEKKSVTELQKSEYEQLQGGQDTQYHNYQKYDDLLDLLKGKN